MKPRGGNRIVLRAPGEKVAARILPLRPVEVTKVEEPVAYAKAKFGAVEFGVPVYAGDSPELIEKRMVELLRERDLPTGAPDANLPGRPSPEPVKPPRKK
jgi:hypothetical protein